MEIEKKRDEKGGGEKKGERGALKTTGANVPSGHNAEDVFLPIPLLFSPHPSSTTIFSGGLSLCRGVV